MLDKTLEELQAEMGGTGVIFTPVVSGTFKEFF